MSVLRTKGLSVGYGKRIVVENISLETLKGQVIAILGPNGVGKSTIIKTIAGLLSPLQGTVYLDGQDLQELTSKQLARRLSVVLTEPISSGLITVFDIVAIGRYPYTGFLGYLSKRDEKIVRESLHLVNAQDLAYRYFSELSDGEKQKVLLARALAQEPKVIVLDEPTSHLDVKYRVEVMGILHHLASEKGVTVLLSSHEIDLVMKTCDIAVLVKNGEIIAYGPPEEVLKGEKITELYDMRKACFNSYLGGIELRSNTQKLVYVVGGSGSGAQLYRALAKYDFGVLTGVLSENDIDFYIARAVGATVIAEKSYQEIGLKPYFEALKLLKRAQQVVDAGFPVRDLNHCNVNLVLQALKQKKLTYTLRNKRETKQLYNSYASRIIHCKSVSLIIRELFHHFDGQMIDKK